MAPIHDAVCNNDLAQVQHFIDSGVDVETKDEEEDFTPLHYASKYGSLEMVQYLVDQKGANVNP
eukprot:CAMPEP_0172448020 /NCGR_PEP_ID=MMETSP1065-20121228/7125_1 /TAXON_ID=265537 /ORGANISM="Amphiprora paludosa, Strain CCMP125" /LENGTH=63 /DNA_ID=CAMNT_0013199399 /DNA_START=125 /DNA_END=312 /DNA_ORIENTATION=-